MTESSPAPPSSWQLYRRLLGHLWPYRGLFMVSVLGMILGALSNTGMAALLRPLIDQGFVERDQAFIAWVPLMMLGLCIGRAAGDFINNYYSQRISSHVMRTLRQRMMHRLLYAPAHLYDKHSSGSLLSRLTFDVDRISEAGFYVLRTLISDSLRIATLLGWMFFISWQVSLIFCVILPATYAIVHRANRRFRDLGKQLQKNMGALTDKTRDLLQAQGTIKAFNTQEHEAGAFGDSNQRFYKETMRFHRLSETIKACVSTLLGLAVVLVVWLAITQELSAGMVSSYLLSVTLLIPSAKRLAQINIRLQSGLAGASSVFWVLDSEPETDPGRRTLPDRPCRMAFEHVSFRYASGRAALDDVSFEIPAGACVALVGVSGSGKSTVAALLLRLYQPDAGRITLDDRPLEDYSLAALRGHISVVTQSGSLFEYSLRDNIAYGSSEPPDPHKLEAAVRAAYLDEFIRTLPDQFTTEIGEHGKQLSGGQQQRVAIARAIYKNAPMLILDEATASLDSIAEQNIQAALQELPGRRTTLIIAHRLSTIVHADKIIVMHEGRVAEQGRHDELLAADGAYAELYRHQARSSS